MRIVQVSTHDIIGGAERVAWTLFSAYRALGHDSWLVAGQKLGDDPNVVTMPNREASTLWTRFWLDLSQRLQAARQRPFTAALAGAANAVASPRKALTRYRGIEDFGYPGTWRLLSMNDTRPDVLHCHNLHGDYFDLRALPWLSREVPLVMTLHDAWLLSGHCAHSLACERWETGCGHCPDLTLEPAVRRDATAYNWRRKRSIYEDSRLHVATPSKWLMSKVERSMLSTAIAEARIIPNGVDTSVFRPGDREAARVSLGIEPTARVVLVAATSVRQNPWKDFTAAREAVRLAAESLAQHDVVLIALGDEAPPERAGLAEIRFLRHELDADAVALHYQAADVYLHPARADTFPNTVLEALACGTPVVATAVGGIPEQITEGATGFLVPAGDARALAERLAQLLSDAALRAELGKRGVETVRSRFDVRHQVDAYLAWYEELIGRRADATRGDAHAVPSTV